MLSIILSGLIHKQNTSGWENVETNNNKSNSTQNAISAYLQECCVGGFAPTFIVVDAIFKATKQQEICFGAREKKTSKQTKTTCENTKQLLAGKDEVMCEKWDKYMQSN